MRTKKSELFASYLQDKQYALSTIEGYCRTLNRLKIDYNLKSPKLLYENIKMCLETFSAYASKGSLNQARTIANRYFEMLTGKNIRDYEKDLYPFDPIDQIIDEFYSYSINFKKISAQTGQSECNHVKPFLQMLSEKELSDLSLITAPMVRDYIMIHFDGIKPSSIGCYVTSLRNFFRFLEYKGIKINPSVFNLPLTPADWKHKKIPVILTHSEEQSLRNWQFADTELGTRNHVILLLMLDLGLRCSELPGIRMEDIHWKEGTVIIRKTKTGMQRELPLSAELGKALEIYILNYRAKLPGNFLLLNVKPIQNHSPMTIASVRSVIRVLFSCCSVSGWWKGTHALRRTIASKIYNSGAGIKLTADILGHKAIESTTYYIKVDFNALRPICREWPKLEETI